MWRTHWTFTPSCCRDGRRFEDKVEAERRMRDLERRYEALRVENDLLKKAIRFNLERRRRNSSS
jgi:hypothetical protein